MNTTTWIIVGFAVLAAIGGAIYYFRSRRKSLDQMFNQVFDSSRQVPAQKKQGFLLLMFKESVIAAKTKDTSGQNKLNNPKYLELQLLQMGSILKDRSKVKDKNMKRALQLYDTYVIWEAAKIKSLKKTA